MGHSEDAFVMTRQERIDNYTFIYVDPDPNDAPPSKKPNVRAEKRTRSSSGSVRKKENGSVKTPDREQLPRRLLPRRQCSVSNAEDGANSQASSEEKDQRGDEQKGSSPKPNAEAQSPQDSPPPVRAWKTAAARKLLPLSITMKRLNVEITKCDWPLLQRRAAASPKKEEEKEERVEREARQPDLGYCSPEVGARLKPPDVDAYPLRIYPKHCCFQQDSRVKPEPSPEEEEEDGDGDVDGDGDGENDGDGDEVEVEEEGEERRGSPASQSEEGGTQQTSSPGSHHSSPQGQPKSTNLLQVLFEFLVCDF